MADDGRGPSKRRLKTAGNLQSIRVVWLFEAVPTPLKSPEEQVFKILNEKGGKLAPGDAVDVVSAWQSSPTEKSPHVWAAVAVSTRHAGHVGDIVLP